MKYLNEVVCKMELTKKLINPIVGINKEYSYGVRST